MYNNEGTKKCFTRSLDKRAIKRQRDVNVSTLVIHHPDPYINKGLSLASWKLNVAGMISIKEQLKIFDAKEEDMKLEVIDGEEVVTEVYRGKNTKGYVGKYPTNGFQCKCKNFCRHIIFYRKLKQLPFFDITSFHKSFHKATVDNINEDIEENDLNEVEIPDSPSIQYLIDEQQNRQRKKGRDKI